MKLINKLLPVATLGSVAAIVTPLTTSCGSGQNLTSFDLQSIYDTTDWLVSETESCRIQDAIDEYADAVSEDKNVFLHDVWYGAKTAFIQYLSQFSASPYNDKYINADIKIMTSEIEVNHTHASINNISFSDNSGHPSVSFDHEVEIDGNLYATIYKDALSYGGQSNNPAVVTAARYITEFSAKISSRVRNIPFEFGIESHANASIIRNFFVLPILQDSFYYDEELLDDLNEDWSGAVTSSYTAKSDIVTLTQQSEQQTITEKCNGGGTVVINQDNHKIWDLDSAAGVLIPDTQTGMVSELTLLPILYFVECLTPLSISSFYFFGTQISK